MVSVTPVFVSVECRFFIDYRRFTKNWQNLCCGSFKKKFPFSAHELWSNSAIIYPLRRLQMLTLKAVFKGANSIDIYNICPAALYSKWEEEGPFVMTLTDVSTTWAEVTIRLWWSLPLRLSKRHCNVITSSLRTTITQMIILHRLMIWLLGPVSRNSR